MSIADQIARRAAELLLGGETSDMQKAIALAGEELGFARSTWPGPVLVRRHARAMAERDLGVEGHRALMHRRLRIAEEIMTLLETQLRPKELWLVGRAAKGQLDADPVIRVRFHGDDPIGTIAAVLVEAGYEEPSFETLSTRVGRLSSLRFNEGEVECVVVRCPPSQVSDSTIDLVTGGAVVRQSLESLRRELASGDDQPMPPLS
ncbi:MAG: hypothetical protein KF724_13230 [Phycisphaeraceae bacterium]|nr:hypothetical protein [Phycisphaeraceae bacterium]